MKLLLILFSAAAVLALAPLRAQTNINVWQPSPGHTQILLWPGAIPDAGTQPVTGPESVTNIPTGNSTFKTWTCINNVTRPTMTVYSPSKDKNTGAAALVFPGGGYMLLAMDAEGTEICDWLNSRGITAVLLKYRVPVRRVGTYGESPQALEDAQRALSLVRYHAADWHINPHKIGVIGFSAGGHMVTATSTHFEHRSYTPVDAADQASCRPDFAIAAYPGHLWDRGGPLELNPNVPVTTNTPPTFLVQAEDDPVDPINNSLVYYLALKNAGVPVEMHLYATGGHAFGLRRQHDPVREWPYLVEKWLTTIGITP